MPHKQKNLESLVASLILCYKRPKFLKEINKPFKGIMALAFKIKR